MYGSRKWNIIHTQLRLKCSNLKSHLVLLHVSDDPVCLCNFDIEDNYHFFFICPLYHIERQKMLNDLRNICNVTLDIVLYGSSNLDLATNKKIFSIVQTYIEKSCRF